MSILTSSKVVLELPPSENNPRNSEGDFIELSDGRIMYAYSRFSGNSWDDHAPSDIYAVFSSDGGDTFDEKPKILVKRESHDTSENKVRNIMSVSCVRFADGALGVFYLAKNSDGTMNGWLRRWQNDAELEKSTVSAVFPLLYPGYYVVNNCRIAKLSDGRLIIPAALHRHGVSPDGALHTDGRGTAYFFISEDDGRSWREAPGNISLSSSHSMTGLQEPGVTELPDGCLLAYMRTDRGFQYQSFSRDGNYWSVPEQSAFTSPASPMKLAKNQYDGRYFAIWNPSDGCRGRDTRFSWGRAPLQLALSGDGLNYGAPDILDDDPVRGFCYPAIYFLSAHSALTAYCSGGADEKACLNRVTIRKITF